MTVEERIDHLMYELKNVYKDEIHENSAFLWQVRSHISALVGELYGQVDTDRRDSYLRRVYFVEDSIRRELSDPNTASSMRRWDWDIEKTVEKEVQDRIRGQLHQLLIDVKDDIKASGAYGSPPEIYYSLDNFKMEYPNPAKVAFIMMDFANTDEHKEIENAIKETLNSFGVTGVLAVTEYHKTLLYNVLTYIYGCGYGIAVFDNIEGTKVGKRGYFNPNVAFELGYMNALRKPVCILKDKNLVDSYVDILGELYTPFETDTNWKIRNTVKVGLETWWRSNKRLVWRSTGT